jgi:hypothetical protein
MSSCRMCISPIAESINPTEMQEITGNDSLAEKIFPFSVFFV